METMTKEQEKFIMMTETPVKRLVCKMAVPTIISMLISALYNMADTFFVGKIGTSATAAVGVVFPLMALIQAIGFFFGHGSGNYMSRKLGEQNREEAVKMASTGFFSSLFCGVVLMTLGLIFIKPLAHLLGATDTILPYAMDYLKFILLGTPFMLTSLVLNNQLRFQGSAFYGMIGIGMGAVVNIILDPIFIFRLHMGVAGAALATMISQALGLLLLLIGTYKNGNVGIYPKEFSFKWAQYKEMIRGGFPSLCRQGLASVAIICLNKFAGAYGDAAIAAMSIVNRVTMFASSALIGFGQGFQPVCGFNYGAKRYDRVRVAFWFCVKLATVFLTCVGILAIVFAPNIIELFRKDDLEVIRIGTVALRAQCVTIPLMGFVIISNMLLQTIGKAVKASIVAMSRQFLFLIPALFLLGNLWGLFGIQICQAVADLCAFILAVPLSMSVIREMKENSKNPVIH